MKTIVLICAVLVSALAGAEPPQYSYPPAGLRPQGAPFTLPFEFQTQQFSAPVQEYALPQTQARLVLIQPGVQQSYVQQQQLQQQQQQQQQQVFNLNYRLPFFYENQQEQQEQQSRYTNAQDTESVDIKGKYSKVSQAKTTKESDAEEIDEREIALSQQQQKQQNFNGRYSEQQNGKQTQQQRQQFQQQYPQYQQQQRQQQFTQNSKNGRIAQYTPPRAYIPVTTEQPTTTTEIVETTTYNDFDEQFNGTKGRGDLNGRFTSPNDDAETLNTSDEDKKSTEGKKASKDGHYFLLLPSGQLQKVMYMTDEDFEKMSFTARLQYENVAPIQGPIFTYNQQSGNFMRVV